MTNSQTSQTDAIGQTESKTEGGLPVVKFYLVVSPKQLRTWAKEMEATNKRMGMKMCYDRSLEMYSTLEPAFKFQDMFQIPSYSVRSD